MPGAHLADPGSYLEDTEEAIGLPQFCHPEWRRGKPLGHLQEDTWRAQDRTGRTFGRPWILPRGYPEAIGLPQFCQPESRLRHLWDTCKRTPGGVSILVNKTEADQ